LREAQIYIKNILKKENITLKRGGGCRFSTGRGGIVSLLGGEELPPLGVVYKYHCTNA